MSKDREPNLPPDGYQPVNTPMGRKRGRGDKYEGLGLTEEQRTALIRRDEATLLGTTAASALNRVREDPHEHVRVVGLVNCVNAFLTKSDSPFRIEATTAEALKARPQGTRGK